eukprot:766664-Hanusia_phi.AAC.4
MDAREGESRRQLHSFKTLKLFIIFLALLLLLLLLLLLSLNPNLVRSKSGNPRRLMCLQTSRALHRDVLGYDSFPDHNLPDRVSSSSSSVEPPPPFLPPLDARLFRKARYLLRLEDGEAWDRLEQTDKLLLLAVRIWAGKDRVAVRWEWVVA